MGTRLAGDGTAAEGRSVHPLVAHPPSSDAVYVSFENARPLPSFTE
jgi:hypothetical protein